MTAPTSQPAYRAYLVNAAGHIYAVRELNCRTDEEAKAAAQEYVDGCGVELWDQGRKIAVFPPTEAADLSHKPNP